MKTNILADLEQSIENFEAMIVAAGITYLLTEDDVMLNLKEEAALAKASCERIKNMVETEGLGE